MSSQAQRDNRRLKGEITDLRATVARLEEEKRANWCCCDDGNGADHLPCPTRLEIWMKRATDAEAKLAAVTKERDEAKLNFAARLSGQLSAVIEERLEYLRGCKLTDAEKQWAQSCIEALSSLKEACYSATTLPDGVTATKEIASLGHELAESNGTIAAQSRRIAELESREVEYLDVTRKQDGRIAELEDKIKELEAKR